MPPRSITKVARFEMSFNPIMSGLTTPYWRITSLLKSLRSGKFNDWASLHAFSAKNVSTLTPSTVASSLPNSDDELLNVHISVVQTLLNAAGKKASTTGPFLSCSLKVTGSRSVSYTHLRAHETPEHLVCRLLLVK